MPSRKRCPRRPHLMEQDVVERIDDQSGVDSPVWPDHRARYLFAAGYARGQTVLDIACGTGYEAPILLTAGARHVTGVDSSSSAVNQAARYASDDFTVMQGSATSLPLPSDSVDLITSFETIEHIDE